MRLFELFATLGLDSGEFDKGIEDATQKGESSSGKLQKSFGLLKTAIVAAVSIATVKKIGDAFVAMGEKADAIDESSQKLGLSKKAYQEWAYVLSQNGGNIESFGVGMKTLQNAMAQGTKATEEAFTKLGLSSNELKKMTPEDALAATIKAFQEMPASAEKTALAMDLFGKQGMELMPTLNQTADATEALKKQANDLGLVLSDEAIDAGAKFSDNMATLKLGLSAVGTNIIAKLMPSISKFIEKILPLADKFLPKLTDAFGAIFEAVWPLIEDGLNLLADAMAWVAENIDWLIPLIGSLIAIFTVLNIVMNANPFSLIVLGIAALVAGIIYLVQNWGSVVGFFERTWESIKTWASGAWDKIVEIWKAVSAWFYDNVIVPVEGLFAAFWLTVSGLFSSLWGWVKGVWEGAKKWFNDNVITPIASAFTNFWNGISSAAKSTWDAITGWISQAITDIKTFLGLTDQASGAHVTTNGSTYGGSGRGFATGIANVPYDNYPINAHKGEAVLTSIQAENWRSGKTSVGTDLSSVAAMFGAEVRAALDGIGMYMGAEPVGKMTYDPVGRNLALAAQAGRYDA